MHLRDLNIHIELIDVQTLIPFDLEEQILKSVMKTGRIIFFDEDVPGGASAYMMHQVLEVQCAWKYLKAQPKTLTGKDHRPAYTTDGDYFSNPSAEDVMEAVMSMMGNK
jgi:2-oxoisovalerate dehydrogenase E1 component